ncbi:uncharacterized protein LOC113119987 isoform X2 [Carassius auratus]|uniref:Uncharacterized protein LOC113119987 isoform X2 n=1 Tax=Carassius auratus TaxID=7957 RepID=A0A6P6RJH0_CARAU|nr:uncharacterized protein LOC113119987 isoform X2 [Carassius auratus]
MYAVVTLQDSDELMVVPSDWLSLDKRHCYWPPFKSIEKCMEAVQNKLYPETEGKPWEKLRIIFLGEYGTFEKAKEGLKEYEEWSYPLETVLPGIKREGLDSTQGMSNNQLQPLPPETPASPSRMSADDAALARNVNRGHCETEIKNYLRCAAGRKKLREKKEVLGMKFQMEFLPQ